jgi:hypothetical protein
MVDAPPVGEQQVANMSQVIQRIDNLGRREAGTLAASTTVRLFASGTPPNNRQAVSIVNCDASAEMYIAVRKAGASTPTLSSSDHDLIVPPRSSRQLQVGAGIDVWARHSGAGTVAYTALELL